MEAWTDLCRCCLTADSEYSLFDGDLNLAQKFFEITTVEVKQDDNLPQKLCTECYSVMNSAIQFRKQCIKMDTELKVQLNQLLSQCNENNIEEFENTIEEESQEDLDVAFANDPMKQLEAIIKKEPMDKDDDYYYVLVIDNPKDKENNEELLPANKILLSIKKEDEVTLPEDHALEKANQQESSVIEVHNALTEQKEPTHTDFEHSMDSFLISNAISANVPATILENEEVQEEENGDLMVYESQDVGLTDDGLHEITDEQNLIKILTAQGQESTIYLKTKDGVQYITNDIITEDDPDDDASEVIFYEGDTDSQFQIVKYDGSELVIEYADEGVSENGTPIFVCECGEQYKDYEEYVTHQQKHNPAGDHLCTLCGKGFETAEILTGHMVLHNVSGLLLQCPFCDAVMKRSALTQHIKYAHNNVKPQCEVCNKTFANPNNLKRHMMIHSGIKEFECNICFKRFAQKITMQTHCLTHINSEQTCPECDVTCKTKELLIEHMESNECKKGKVIDTHTKEELMKTVKKEVKTNLGKLLGYACALCKRMFSVESALERHIEATHIIDPSELLCSICGEVVGSKKEMLAHIATHDKRKIVKRFECSSCGKGCSSQAMLLMHERVHTNERPYSCQLCPLKFKTKTHLRTHQLTHTREKKFGCSVCMKFFALKGNLVVHLRTHTGERPYVCSVCGDAFIDSKYLKKHKQKKHNVENPWNQFLQVKYEDDV